jgi:hypothetical protein
VARTRRFVTVAVVELTDDTAGPAPTAGWSTGPLGLLERSTVAELTALAAAPCAPGVVLHAGPGGLGLAAACALASEALRRPSVALGTGPDPLSDLTVASPDGDTWSVEEVDDRIVAAAALRPVRFNVVVVDRAAHMSARAFDRLLKTVEQPPAPTWFILVATDASKLPATVSGRLAQVVMLQRRHGTAFVEALAAAGAPAAEAPEVARLCGELVEVALAVVAAAGALEDLRALDLWWPMPAKERNARFASLGAVAGPAMGMELTAASRELIRQCLALARRHYRDLARSGAEASVHGVALLDDAEKLLALNVPPKSVFAGLAGLGALSSTA